MNDPRNRFRPALTRLECRLVPTARLSPNGTLLISGTSGNDTVFVTEQLSSGKITVSAKKGDASVTSFDAKDIKSILIDTGSGDDAVTLQMNVKSPVAVTQVNETTRAAFIRYIDNARNVEIINQTMSDSIHRETVREMGEMEKYSAAAQKKLLDATTPKQTVKVEGGNGDDNVVEDFFWLGVMLSKDNLGAGKNSVSVDLSDAPKGTKLHMPDIVGSPKGQDTLSVQTGDGNDNVSFNRDSAGQLVTTVNGEADRSDFKYGDIIKALGGDGNDVIKLLAGAAVAYRADFFGQNGNDTLVGGRNDDHLDGGFGTNSLTGNGGKDDFLNGTPKNLTAVEFKATAAPNTLVQPGNEVRGFSDTDKQDGWVPFFFNVKGKSGVQLVKVQVIMRVKPNGGLTDTDILQLRGKSGVGATIYGGFGNLVQLKYQTVVVDVDPVQFADVYRKIQAGGKVEGLIEDDTAVASVTLRCFYNA